MAIKRLDSSAHFVYKWDDTVNGSLQRAAALQATCEKDLSTLESLFGEFNGFDGNRVTVIAGDPGSGALARNTKFHSDGTTAITVTAWSGVNPAATADAGVRLEFIAEMSEVMMGLRNARRKSTTWNPGGSNGEGLSQFLAEWFYRSAYYDAQLGHGPRRITGWLNGSGRPDWVTKTDSKDDDEVTYGCAFLFLHFLHTQKGYSVQDIITKGADTLEATYTALTGHGGGWTEFIGLLNRFYPMTDSDKKPITYSPARCNLFPLYDDRRRSASIDWEEVGGPPIKLGGGGMVHVSPGALCPGGDYTWQWADPNTHLELSVRPVGFGNPVVTWVVDGVSVPTGSSSVTVTGDVEVDVAGAPDKPTATSQTFRLSTTTGTSNDTQGPLATLKLLPMDKPGTEQVTIQVRVDEQYATVPAFTEITWATLHTHSVDYDIRYHVDRAACQAKWDDFVKRHVRVKVINILLTLPDPGPVEFSRFARLIDQVQAELARLAKEDPKMARLLGQDLARTLRVSPRLLHADEGRGAE
ncbi:MAG: hypothetical protein ACXV5Q_03070 [Frankiaceae bacterium]